MKTLNVHRVSIHPFPMQWLVQVGRTGYPTSEKFHYHTDTENMCMYEWTARSICRDWPHVELRSLEAEHDLHAPQDLKVVIENQIGMQTFSLVRWQLLIATPNHWILRPQKKFPSFTASVSLQVKCILTFARGHSFWSKIDLNHA